MDLLDFYKGKRVLITGHTGFKGSWLTRILTLAGAEVTGYSLEPAEDPALFHLLRLGETMDHRRGDIRDPEHFMKVFEETRPEIVFHLAAQPIVRDSYRDPVYTYETNVMGTVHVLECIRRSPYVRSFVNVTTDKVYENREWEYGYRETDRLDGYDPYSNSKSCSELVTHSYRQSFLDKQGCAVSTCRAGNVIGGGDFAHDRIIPDCVRAAAAGGQIIVRNPRSIRPFQHVLEPLYVYLLVAGRQAERPELSGNYNVGPDDADCVCTGRLTELFCQKWGGGLSWIERGDGGPHEAGFLKLDCSRVKHVFGWRPLYHIEEAIEKTVEWSKAWLDGADLRSVTDRQIREFFDHHFDHHV
ncbi:CDP-glucose 4,6-dehydratase [Clostridiaceae bacterium]|nr:CDP-glucose 4,6-dehydratase [Clostridium sp.]NBI72002.1 CDP-glucose 4,6-dehydratase [Clostridiaceae bacterium]